MAKINIMKPTGNKEILGLVSAFKVDGNVYIVLDSEKTGSMGLPIIYVSKYNNGKLEKINDTNEWQSVKNYLKGIINGTNFEYIKVSEELNADEAYYMPLTLPQASFDLIKSRYVVKENDTDNSSGNAPTLEATADVNSTTPVSVAPAPTSASPIPNVSATPAINSAINIPNAAPEIAPVSPSMPNNIEATNRVANVPPQVQPVQNVAPSSPVMPNNNVSSNAVVNSTVATPHLSDLISTVTDSIPTPTVTATPVVPAVQSTVQTTNVSQNKVDDSTNFIDNNFASDKETFLKACENMFDALISKYQKQLADLERREQIITQKEQEIEQKLHNANEHLANAEAREQVANIAHDNAQKIMDLGNLMPISPDNNEAGVI